MKQEKEYYGSESDDSSKKSIFYLYDTTEEDNPILVPSFGFRTKLIDYEYSFVNSSAGISYQNLAFTSSGKPFDSKLDLINNFYIPCEFDSSYDVLRFVISTCRYYIQAV